jgi:hypothetical protein
MLTVSNIGIRNKILCPFLSRAHKVRRISGGVANMPEFKRLWRRKVWEWVDRLPGGIPTYLE